MREIGPIAESRPAAIAKSLRMAARKARAPANTWTGGGGGLRARSGRQLFIIGVVISFILVILLPVVGSAIYLGLIASDQFATEVRFAVRGNERSSVDTIGAITGLPSTSQIQDSMIVAEFIASRGMVEELEKAVPLREMYSRPEIDFLSRLYPSEPVEDVVRYWRRRIDVDVASSSGIITIVVRAFTPDESFRVANAVITLSERLANSLSERAREDALKQARVELDRARANLDVKIAAMRDLRNDDRVLDATKAASAMTDMLTELKLSLLRLEDEYTTQRRSVSENAPQIRVLSARIESLRGQIKQIEDQLTRGSNSSGSPLSETMGQFDRGAIERSVAEKQYIDTAVSFERARLNTLSQQLYITSFLRPVVAQKALYPKRFILWSIISIIAIVTWSIGITAATMARNYLVN